LFVHPSIHLLTIVYENPVGVNMFWFQMCLELVKEVGLKQFFHIVDIERKAVYIKEEDISGG